MNRREFFRLSAVGAVAAAVGRFPLAYAAASTTVVCVTNAKASETALDVESIRRMVEKGLLAFTGKTSVAAAWKEFVSPKDILGLKINCLGRNMLPTHPAFTEAIIKSLVSAGMDENNIIVWDRYGTQMVEGGYQLKSGPGVKYLASEGPTEAVGYDEKVIYEPSNPQAPRARTKLPPAPSAVARILTQKITAMINLPVLKNHRAAGVTLCLKNIAFGVTNNSGQWHVNNCDPMIPEVCAMPVVQKKLRLNILDGLEACYDGGPYPRDPKLIWRPGKIYVATDMVALDTVAAEVIDQKRKEKGLPPATRIATHLATAARMKLGTNQRSAIRVENVSV